MTSFEDVRNARNLHADAIGSYTEAVNAMASAEYDYDVARALAITALEKSGAKSTTVGKLADGDETVASRKMAVTIAKGVVKAADARMQATYNDWKQAQVYEDRDWRQGGMQ